jgi:hypothetical protein
LGGQSPELGEQSSPHSPCSQGTFRTLGGDFFMKKEKGKRKKKKEKRKKKKEKRKKKKEKRKKKKEKRKNREI